MPKLLDPARALVRLDESRPSGGVTVITEADKPSRFLVKIIDEGEGSSGYYPADALMLAEADRVFAAGTHMYLDHAAALRRGPGGERSVRDLAAVLIEDAHYDAALRALVAEARIFGDHAEALAEMAPHIGVSISASAIMGPPMEGQRKATVRRLVMAESVDFVTHAGRGGAILAVLESGRADIAETTASDLGDQIGRAVRAAYHDPASDQFAGLRDFDPDAGLAYFYRGDAVWRQPYEAAADGLSVTLTGAPEEVRVVITYVPVQSGGVTAPTQEAPMSDELKDKVATLEQQLSEATKRADEAEAKLAEADLRDKVTEAKRQVSAKVAAKTEGMPATMATRIAEAVDAQITTPDVPADIETRIDAAIEAEKAYARSLSVTESKLVGFGASEAASSTAKPTRSPWGREIKE